GAATYATYGLSLQIVNIMQGVSQVWVNVKWPLVGQLRTRHDYPGLRRVLWPRLWLQNLTFLALAAFAFGLGPACLRLMGSDKELLPPPLLFLLLFHGFLEVQTSFWTTMLSTENRIPSVWPITITNLASVLLAAVLARTTTLGLGTFVVAPICTWLVFN